MWRLPCTHFGSMGLIKAALGGEQERQDANAFARLLHREVVLSDPGPYQLAFMPGGVIPNQQPVVLALCCQTFATPIEKLDRDGTHRTSRHKAQPDLLAHGVIGWSFLP